MSGSTAWADLGFCAMALGDLTLADESFKKGLQQPTMFYLLERARILAGAALLALTHNNIGEAKRQASEARTYAEERQMRHVYPLTSLVEGKVLLANGNPEAALQVFERSEIEAVALGMRPYILDARLAQAQTLSNMGREDDAIEKMKEAQSMVEEIAELIQDEALRGEYLRNKLTKVKADVI